MDREILKPLVGGRRQLFTGVFIRTGFKHNGEETATILLRDVKLDGTEPVTGHIWLPYTSELTKLGMLWPGDVISFKATVISYDHAGSKYAVGDSVFSDNFYTEYGVTRPTKFKMISEANVPEDIERIDISNLRNDNAFQEKINKFVKNLSYQISIHESELDIPKPSYEDDESADEDGY